MKTSELSGAALDWAVAKCEGVTPIGVKKKYSDGYILYSLPASTIPLEYSTNWSQGGPIIEREHICIFVRNDTWPDHQRWSARPNTPDGDAEFGPTPLIAAMRCYVASKLGDEVEIPEELQ